MTTNYDPWSLLWELIGILFFTVLFDNCSPAGIWKGNADVHFRWEVRILAPSTLFLCDLTMTLALQWRCGVSWGTVVVGVGRCAPLFFRGCVGRWAGLSHLCSVPVDTSWAPPFLYFFFFHLFWREGLKVCRFSFLTVRDCILIHQFFRLGFSTDALRIYRGD